jgi:hypothetical protein
MGEGYHYACGHCTSLSCISGQICAEQNGNPDLSVADLAEPADRLEVPDGGVD